MCLPDSLQQRHCLGNIKRGENSKLIFLYPTFAGRKWAAQTWRTPSSWPADVLHCTVLYCTVLFVLYCADLTYPLDLASWWPLLCWAHSWSAQPELDAGPGHGGDTHTRHSLYMQIILYTVYKLELSTGLREVSASEESPYEDLQFVESVEFSLYRFPKTPHGHCFSWSPVDSSSR